MTFRQLSREMLSTHTTEQADALCDRLARALQQNPDRELCAHEEQVLRNTFKFNVAATRASPLYGAALKDFAAAEMARLESRFN